LPGAVLRSLPTFRNSSSSFLCRPRFSRWRVTTFLVFSRAAARSQALLNALNARSWLPHLSAHAPLDPSRF